MRAVIGLKLVQRRDFLKFAGMGILSGTSLALLPNMALADESGPKAINASIGKIAGNKKVVAGKITLDLPQIAENGNTVPVGFTVASPMTKSNYVKSVHLFSDKNPGHEVATFHFSPASGKASASTRMRMIKTQNVIAVAEMSDGSIYTGKKEVKVTIGGCGG
jgi:sulfur-oxidizing protein SoxY